MSKLRFTISMSLDGFIAGPNQSVANPLGMGGMRLHEWIFPLKAFRKMHGEDNGIVNDSNTIVEEMFANVGAHVMGRNMFGGYPGPWEPTKPWNGWWGGNPPFHNPVFVLTHYPREPLKFEGGTTFNFVTDGIEAALELAQKAAGSQDVHLGGGANVARQFFNKGLVDEMNINLVPILLGSGERLFDGTGHDLHGLELIRTVVAPKVLHLKFAKHS